MKKIEYYYPWSTGRPPFPKSFGNIVTNLQRLGFPVFHYQKKENKPDLRTMKAVKFICETLYAFDEDKAVRRGSKAPWLFLLSNSSVLLQALADLVPMVYATTFGASVMKVDNTSLTSAILSPKPKSVWDEDPSGEFVAEAKKTNLLFWNFIHRSVNKSRFCEGEIGNIMDLRSGKPTVFTATYYGRYFPVGKESESETGEKSEKPTSEAIIGTVEKVFGDTVSGAVDSSAKMVHLAVKRKMDNKVMEVEL